jgi:hypothetical protein
MKPSMDGAAVAGRIRRLGQLSDLTPERRLHAKIDMSGEAIARRIRSVAQSLRLCRKLGVIAGGVSPRPLGRDAQ